jgi:threonine/homoserine/homoserine lactone efflux protein
VTAILLIRRVDIDSLVVVVMEWATLATLLTLLALGMAVPGPNNSACAAHASIHGRRSNIPLIIGLGIGFFGVNVICGLAVNAFEADSFIGKFLHYLGSLLMILLGLALIFIGTSKRTINVTTSIPRLGLKTGIIMQIVNTKQWMVIFSLITVMLSSFESEPGGIPGGVPGTFFIATVNTSFGFLSMGVWTNVGDRVQQRISNPKFARIVILALGVLLLILSTLMLLRFHFG